jgi:hypothetical protein
VPGALDFGRLNTLRSGLRGRYPTEDEWKLLAENTERLYRQLDDDVRRWFLYGQIPGWVTQTAILLGTAALVALVFAVALRAVGSESATAVLPLYVIWLAALGAMARFHLSK